MTKAGSTEKVIREIRRRGVLHEVFHDLDEVDNEFNSPIG